MMAEKDVGRPAEVVCPSGDFPMTSLGQRLRQERLARGIDIATIAADTRICSRYLEAIEKDNYSSLPGGFFRRAFVRQYANALGVSDSEVDTYLMQIEPETPTFLPDPPPKPVLSLWAKSSNLAVGLVAGLLMVAAGGYAWWRSDAPVSPPAPQTQSATPAPVPVPASATEQQEAAPAPPQESTPERSSPAAPETPTPAENATLRLMATEPTWVSVSSQGKTLFVGILARDETRAIEGVERARLLVGNAGGLEVRWRGEPVGPIGPRGQTRIVWLKPEGVEIESPRKPET